MTDQNQMHDDDKKNLIIFIVAAMLVWLAFDHFLIQPRMEAMRAQQQAEQEAAAKAEENGTPPAPLQSRAEALQESPRLPIDNGAIAGSIALRGGRLDDLRLHNYYKTHDRVDSVEVLSPAGTDHARYVEFGWLASGDGIRVPDRDSVWSLSNGNGNAISKDNPVSLYWDNGDGLLFERTITVDENFMFTVTQRVTNNSTKSVTLYPYAIISEHGMPDDLFKSAIIHEGPIGYIDGKLIEHSYRKIEKQKLEDVTARNGWIGITQNYWLTALVPAQDEDTKFRFLYTAPAAGSDKARYQVDAMGPARTVAPGASAESMTHAYLGAKIVKLLANYEKTLGVTHFDLAVDFGMYYFLTKPFYYILTYFGNLTGNFGIAIIIMTFLVRLAVFPLANTSFRSFAKLKKISPKMHELREKYGDDKQKLQEELVKLYEKEKVNPMAGCLPILVQIPIFFALFKVLQIAIEIRHAPFYGWIHDLSERDPTSVFNLFGLIPWTPPEVMMIGAWPCLMLFFMIVQKKMNPPPQDKTQAMMINFMPFFITYILAKFPAGLVIYWTFGNALSVLQQYIIMRGMGVEVHWFKKPEAEKELEKEVAEGPAVHPELGVIGDEVEKAMFGDDDKDGDDKPTKVSPPKKKKSKKKK